MSSPLTSPWSNEFDPTASEVEREDTPPSFLTPHPSLECSSAVTVAHQALVTLFQQGVDIQLIQIVQIGNQACFQVFGHL